MRRIKAEAPTIPSFVDCHIHSRFSIDSASEPEQICQSAVKCGLAGICITDHLDHCPADAGFGYYNPRAYFEQIDRVRDRYSDRLQILCGIEFGDPHRFPWQFDKYAKLPYDCIIGSVHYWYRDMRVEDLPPSVPFEEAMEAYFLAVEASLRFGGFEILGHLGFPKKYYQREITAYDQDVVDSILSLCVRNDVALEINTSSMTQGMPEPSPNNELTNRYIAMGGQRATLGSDAHTAENVGSCFKCIWERYGTQLRFGHFENRQFCTMEMETK